MSNEAELLEVVKAARDMLAAHDRINEFEALPEWPTAASLRTALANLDARNP